MTRAIPHAYLREMPEIAVARVALGLTVYLDEPLVWAREGAAAVLSGFLVRAPETGVAWYTTSLLSDWQRVGRASAEKLAEGLSRWQLTRPRHLLWVRVVDDTGAPSVAFSYREVDTERSGRAGFLQLILPQDHEPGALLDLALEVGESWPVLCAVGGHVATWNEYEKPTAFWQIYEWCRRYLGLDAQDPDAVSRHVARGLPGTSWLTLIGDALADSLGVDPGALQSHSWKTAVSVSRLTRGTLLRAGDAPELGDRNRLAYPASYAEVARRLAPYLLADPPEYFGGFAEHKATKRWMHRFLRPSEWT
jgi:hypothetical protein